MLLIPFNRQESDLGLNLRPTMNWLCDSVQSTFFPLKQDGNRGQEDISGPFFPECLFSNSRFTWSHIWPLASPIAIAQRSDLLTNHLCSLLSYFLDHICTILTTGNQETCGLSARWSACVLQTASQPWWVGEDYLLSRWSVSFTKSKYRFQMYPPQRRIQL